MLLSFLGLVMYQLRGWESAGVFIRTLTDRFPDENANLPVYDPWSTCMAVGIDANLPVLKTQH